MALTGLDIYKQLPKENCGECGVPTCLAFAMKLAQKQASLDDCPRVTDEARAALSDAAAPPIKLITIGVGEKALSVGNETVEYRHDETFYHPTGVAVVVDASLDADALAARIERIKSLNWERVGQQIGVDLVAVKDAGDAACFAAVADKAAKDTGLPLILISDSEDAISLALEAVGERKPLICGATAANVDGMANLACRENCPLVVRADGLDALAELSQKAQAAGATNLILDSGARKWARVLQDQTAIRRAALKKKFRPFGFPTIAFTSADNPSTEALQATSYIEKFAGIVVLESAEPWAVLAVLTARQNIYTDPQKPIQIEEGIYQVGQPDEASPVLVTTNFSLTYFTVEGDVDASKVPAWIVVCDTEGTSVLTAWAAEKFTAESIAAKMKAFDIEGKVKHRNVIIPGYVAVLSGKLEDESGWKVHVGPRESSGIPSYLRNTWPTIAAA
jgi:acetyl-CoA decarbonylase/synthase complex subunit gamma